MSTCLLESHVHRFLGARDLTFRNSIGISLSIIPPRDGILDLIEFDVDLSDEDVDLADLTSRAGSDQGQSLAIVISKPAVRYLKMIGADELVSEVPRLA